MNFLILSLNALAHINISGVTGVFKKQYPKLKISYYFTYILLFAGITLLSAITFLATGISLHTVILRSPAWIALLLSLGAIAVQFIIEYLLILGAAKGKHLNISAPVLTISVKIEMLAIGVFEEISYRLFIFGAIQIITGSCIASVVISSLLYMLNHWYMLKKSNAFCAQAIGKFIFGVILALLYQYFGLLCSIIAHLLYNFIILFIMPVAMKFSGEKK